MEFNTADYIGLEARPAPRSIMKKLQGGQRFVKKMTQSVTSNE